MTVTLAYLVQHQTYTLVYTTIPDARGIQDYERTYSLTPNPIPSPGLPPMSPTLHRWPATCPMTRPNTVQLTSSIAVSPLKSIIPDVELRPNDERATPEDQERYK